MTPAHMQAALALGRRGHGVTWPNPSVGCVIVAADGRVVGRGRTGDGGRPHAEAAALAMAGAAARGGTAFVTLEPCAHVSDRGPPCAPALVAAGLARVVVALGDPDPRVSGRGLAILRAAGIEVEAGPGEAEAAYDLAGFLLGVSHRRPLVTLKLATTLDGRIAAQGGDSRWITGAPARHAAHMLRATHDAVLVGIGTALADDPALTCRIDGARPPEPALIRIVADSHLRLPPTAALVVTARQTPTWLLARPDADPVRRSALEQHGVVVISVAPDNVGLNPRLAMEALGGRGLTRILVEGGARLAAALLRADLVDRLAWFHAPAVMGGDGVPATASLGIERVAALARFVRLDSRPVGHDILTTFTRGRGLTCSPAS